MVKFRWLAFALAVLVSNCSYFSPELVFRRLRPIETLLFSPINSATTHPKRTTRSTKKVRQARLDFVTRGNRPTLLMSSTPVQMRLLYPRTTLFASQQAGPPLRMKGKDVKVTGSNKISACLATV